MPVKARSGSFTLAIPLLTVDLSAMHDTFMLRQKPTFEASVHTKFGKDWTFCEVQLLVERLTGKQRRDQYNCLVDAL